MLSAEVLAEIGFCRMVAPRELPLRDIRTLCRNSPIETEISFTAPCVSAIPDNAFSVPLSGGAAEIAESVPNRAGCRTAPAIRMR